QEVELSVDEIIPGLKECQLSLIGKIHGDKKANLNGLKTTLNSIWTTRKEFHIRSLSNNKFQFLFQREEDRDRILQGKTWSFDGQYILMKLWSPISNDFSYEEEVIKVWVHILNLPLHWTSFDIGLKIGKRIGKTLDFQLPGTSDQLGHIMKVLVEFNVNEPLPRGSLIKVGSDSTWVDFRYENLQTFCFYCGKLGHSDKNCEIKSGDVKNNEVNIGQYEEWLRARIVSSGHSRSPSSLNQGSQSSEKDKLTRSNQLVARSEVGERLRNSVSSNQDTQQGGEKGITQLETPLPMEETAQAVFENPILIPKGSEGASASKNPDSSDGDLVEVTILPTVMEGNTGSRKKATFSRKPRSSKGLTSEIMQVDKNGEVEKKIIITMCKNLRLHDNWFYVKPEGRKGGLFLTWSDNISLIEVNSLGFCLEVCFSFKGFSDIFWGVFVYASTDNVVRARQWEVLVRHSLTWGSFWFLCGDFNDILCQADKNGGVRREEASFSNFRDFIRTLGVVKIMSVGQPFTWSNNKRGSAFVEEKLDRFFVSPDLI
ncbi:Unknown protein, partial [Striga hermonthica]